MLTRCPLANKVCEERDLPATGHSVQKVLPKGDVKLSTGLLETGKGVSAATPNVVTGRAADLAFLDILTDVSLTQVVM